MQATAAGRSESELQAELAKAEKQIADGEGDVLALLEERESVTRELQAVRLKKEHEDSVAYKAKLQARTDEFRKRLMPIAENVADSVGRLVWWLTRLEELERESHASEGQSYEATGIPWNFSRPVLDAIRSASPNTDWHYPDFLNAPDAKCPLPTPKIRGELLLQVGRTDIYGNPLGPDGSPATYRLPPGIGFLPHGEPR